MQAPGPGGDSIFEKLGAEWIQASADFVKARIPVEGNTDDRGNLHGGARSALAETLASVGAWLNNLDKAVMGIELGVNHIRDSRSGWVTGEGRPLSRNGSEQLWEMRMTDDSGELVGLATCTLAVREPRSS